MARALELVFARLPIGCTAEVGATSVDTKSLSEVFVTQMRYCCCHLVSTPLMRSHSEVHLEKYLKVRRSPRGRENRRNIKKQVARNPVTLAQTIRRRILLTAAVRFQLLIWWRNGTRGRRGTAAFGAAGGVAGSAHWVSTGSAGARSGLLDYPLTKPPSVGSATWLASRCAL